VLKGIITGICLCIALIGSAQDIENIIKSDPIKFSGNLSISGSSFTTSRDLGDRSPYSYSIQGTPTLSIYSFKIPITISIRDSKFNFSNQISRISLNPKYKFVQLFIGSRSYQFSPYTLAGQNINGLGLELTPGNFRFTLIKGKMENLLPQIDTMVYGTELIPVYQRDALAARLGFNSAIADIEFMALKAKDQLDPPVEILDSLRSTLTPEENLVLGLRVETTIARLFTMGLNMGGSVFTNDHTNDTIAIEETYQELASSTLTPTTSTRFSYAGDIFARVNYKGFTIGLKVKQIEPLYRTLGLYYTQNDFRNITLNTRIPLFKRKLFIGLTYGVQRNNLREIRLRTNKRNIVSAQMNYNSGKVLSLTANYSNFSQDQSPGLVAVEDTLRYAQVSKNLTLVPRLQFRNESTTQNITLSLVRFGLEDLSTFYDEPRNSTSLITSLGYNIKWKNSGLGIKLGGNYNTTESIEIATRRYGGTLGLSKKLGKKSSISLSTTYNIRSNEFTRIGSISNTRLSLRFTPVKKQRFSLNLSNLLRRFESRENTNDIRINASYSMSF